MVTPVTWLVLHLIGWIVMSVCLLDDPDDMDTIFKTLICSFFAWEIMLVLIILMAGTAWLVSLKKKVFE